MTTALVVRLDKQRADLLKEEARKRGATRNEVVRRALDNFLGAPVSRKPARNGADRRRAKPVAKESSKGVGWAEHFEWLKKHGRKIDGKVMEEIDDLENNRGFR